MYSNFKNTHKLVTYLNNKYGYNFSYNSLVLYCSRNGINKNNKNSSSSRQITKQDEEKIIELYNSGFNSYELADIFGYKTKKSILDILRANNIVVRNSMDIASSKRSYKNFSFEHIDSHKKAYIIGLLLSDGYVNGDRNYVGIDLCDLDAIQFISNFVNVKYKTIYSKNNNHKDKYRVLIYGKEYLQELERFGIFPRKSLTTNGCKLYSGEEIFIPSIIRGLIDGDGWIREDGREFFISSASRGLIDWVYKELIKLGFTNIKPIYIPNKSNGIYMIRTATKENILILKNKIYKNRLGMNRKYNRLHMINVQRV